MSDLFDIVDEADRVVGQAPRRACHGNPRLIHRAVHVLVFNRAGELLLQKRSADKDIQPGRWDTSVGGHLDPGEDYLTAARREMAEELGLEGELYFLYHSKIRNAIESENIATYLTWAETWGDYSRREISALRWWTPREIDAALGSGDFTPNFEEEWSAWQSWCRENFSLLSTWRVGGLTSAPRGI